MKDARTTFEIYMRAKGYQNFLRNKNGNYVYSGMQNKWNYFLNGWEMRGL